MSKHVSLEPTFAEALQAVAAAADLTEQKRRHWQSSLAMIAKAFDQPIEIIPARFSAIKARMAALHHVPMGWSKKTLHNHRCNAKAALIWYRNEKGVPANGVPLSAEWQRLAAQLDDPSTRYRLLPLMRYCSGRGIVPGAVNEQVIDDYLDFRVRTTTRGGDAATRRVLARLWNGCIATIDHWPTLRLVEPPVRTTGPAWEDLAEELRTGFEGYLARLAGIHRNGLGQRCRPCQPSTLITRKREFMAAVSMAVRMGIPLNSLTSLQACMHPDVAEKILEGYWQDGQEAPSTYTINLAGRFVELGRFAGLDDAALKRLGDIRFALEEHRDDGMTEKNLDLIRQVLTQGVWSRVAKLPEQLMREARLLRPHAPVRGAVLAQIAVAVAILKIAPIRLANLAAIRLDENLNKPGGPYSNFWLKFRKYDVKNRRRLEFCLDETTTGIIDEYVHNFRPTLLRGSNADWLFPGEAGNHKEKISFSTQIVERVHKSTGLRITVHQFRHAAAALILEQYPANYELVRQMLGHKNVQTSAKSYCALEMIQASKIFTDIVAQKVNFKPRAA